MSLAAVTTTIAWNDGFDSGVRWALDHSDLAATYADSAPASAGSPERLREHAEANAYSRLQSATPPGAPQPATEATTS